MRKGQYTIMWASSVVNVADLGLPATAALRTVARLCKRHTISATLYDAAGFLRARVNDLGMWQME